VHERWGHYFSAEDFPGWGPGGRDRGSDSLQRQRYNWLLPSRAATPRDNRALPREPLMPNSCPTVVATLDKPPMLTHVTLKFCYHGQHSKPEDYFRVLPGTHKRAICLDCYAKIRADKKLKKTPKRRV
jgi:hypothetical protein